MSWPPAFLSGSRHSGNASDDRNCRAPTETVKRRKAKAGVAQSVVGDLGLEFAHIARRPRAERLNSTALWRPVVPLAACRQAALHWYARDDALLGKRFL